MQYILRKGEINLSDERRYKSYLVFERLITERNITSYRVAKDLGFSPMILSDWKNDKSKPKFDRLFKIAEYLGVDVSLFADENVA